MNYNRAIRSVVILVLIAFIIAYLQNMKTCECVEPPLVKSLEYTELVIAALISIGLIVNIATDGKFKTKSLGRLANAGLMTVIVGSFGYLAYLVYHYSVDATGCECADKNAKYVLYAQGAFYAVLVGIALLTTSLQ